ncbi:MAG: class I SAM-dependent methyltransferase [Dehalococcoidia bacterium]|jgi:ubiquinone/menaquinone biosynthesis C-methylase UbiE
MKLLNKIHFLDRELCPWWFAYTFDNPGRRILHKPEKVLGAYVREGMTVVDIGCGMGHFSIGMAKLVGASGRVIAVDLQQKMLDRVKRRMVRGGVDDRISLRLCKVGDIGVSEQADFVLTFWMVHEVTDAKLMFGQIHAIVKDGGRWMLAEPKLHLSLERFEKILSEAVASGFSVVARPAVTMSYAAVLDKSRK